MSEYKNETIILICLVLSPCCDLSWVTNRSQLDGPICPTLTLKPIKVCGSVTAAVRDQHEGLVNLILSTPLGVHTINMADSEGTTPILEAVKASCLQVCVC